MEPFEEDNCLQLAIWEEALRRAEAADPGDILPPYDPTQRRAAEAYIAGVARR